MPKLKRKLRLNNQNHLLPANATASTESSELSLFTQSVRGEKKPLGKSLDALMFMTAEKCLSKSQPILKNLFPRKGNQNYGFRFEDD